MLNLLFVDSFNVLSSQLQTALVHQLSRSSPLSTKIESVSMELLSFKCGVLDALQKFVGRVAPTQGLNQQIQEEVDSNKNKLQKYRLHQILKKKVSKRRRESMLLNSQTQLDQQVSQLEQSIVLIEKDLGIENDEEEESRLNISAMISQSLAGLEATPISRVEVRDESMMSEVASLNIDHQSMKMSQKSVNDLSMPEVPQLTESTTGKGDKPKDTLKTSPAAVKKEPSKQPVKKTDFPKKKKTPTPQNQNKDGLLGNLLNETFEQCSK